MIVLTAHTAAVERLHTMKKMMWGFVAEDAAEASPKIAGRSSMWRH
jgi:hypothetical protein